MSIQIIRLPEGERITRPGFYEISLERHHSDCCDGPSVTSTGLRTLDLKTPLHFHDGWSGNPNRDKEDPEKIEADYFRIGRAGHCLMLEPKLFAERFATRPAEFDSWRTKASKEWLAETQKRGVTVLTPEEHDRVHAIAQALRDHPWHSEGILGGVVECSMVCRDRKTGIWLKSRPDAIPLTNVITDLKVMNDASPRSVKSAIRSLGYDMQLALAGVCMNILTGVTIEQMWLVAVEAKRPYAIHVESLSLDAIHWARLRLRRALDTIAQCINDDYWPSYGQDGDEYTPASYEVENYAQAQRSGGLPTDAEF